MKQAHNSSSMLKVCSDITPSIQIVFLLFYRILNSNIFSSGTSLIFLSNLLLSIFDNIFALCDMRLNVLCSLHFVTFGFICKAFTINSVRSLGLSPVSYMLLISYVPILGPFSSKYRVIHKSVKHLKNSQPIHYSTDHGNSYANRERNSPSFFFYIFHRCSVCPPLVIRQTSMR